MSDWVTWTPATLWRGLPGGWMIGLRHGRLCFFLDQEIEPFGAKVWQRTGDRWDWSVVDEMGVEKASGGGMDSAEGAAREAVKDVACLLAGERLRKIASTP